MVMKGISMKNKFVSLLFSLFLLVSIISPVFAQDYFFEVPEQDIHIFIEPDGSITIEYFYLFQNTPGAQSRIHHMWTASHWD
jgi:hypothetical protein